MRVVTTLVLFLVLLLVAGTFIPHLGPLKAVAVSNPVIFTLKASFFGWNSTTGANPGITQFRGVQFTANIVWVDSVHDFGIYTKGFPATSVSQANVCSPSNTVGCLAVSPLVSSPSSLTAQLKFTPTIPPDDFTGPGTYEYYCQIHPSVMHGKITLFKSPDLLNRGTVDIVDIATMAFYFSTTVTASSPANQKASDIDNNGVVNILDIAQAAFYFGQPF